MLYVYAPKVEATGCLYTQVYYCAYVGSFGEFSCNPRTLSSPHLNHMVSLEGIVTKCSLVRPKVVKSVHWNENKSIFQFREYRDQTMTMGAASTSVYPTEDDDGNPVSSRCNAQKGWRLTKIAGHRVRIQHIPRPPDNLHTRNARARSRWPASSWC